jgi:hypothetical protein
LKNESLGTGRPQSKWENILDPRETLCDVDNLMEVASRIYHFPKTL